MMAVAPEHQGKGIGSALLRGVLEGAEQRDPTPPTVLTTHLETNVTYYRRAGFQVTDQRTLTPPGSDPYSVWSMRK
jgi:predicted N-acetyltransferase YhbS